MKTSQILYLLVFVGIIVSIVTSTHLLDGDHEGFESNMLPVNAQSEPVIAKGIEPTRLSMQATPNSSTPGTLPFGPYGQMASVGSYQYQDPAQLPAELQQMKQLHEDIRSFLVFEGSSVASSSDPTVQLPLTQLRADSNKLEQEISVLKNNPGIQASMTQQDVADIQGALTFLQRKVRLFQTSGVISDTESSTEGFQGSRSRSRSEPLEKTRATKRDLQTLQTKIYSAILILSSSGTSAPTVQARIKRLQDMYSAITDMINKLDKGIWTATDIPVFEEDIRAILPNLANPRLAIMNIFSQKSGKKLSPVEQQLAGLVGEDNAKSVFKSLKDKGMFRVNVELGYNVNESKKSKSDIVYSKSMDLLSQSDSNPSGTVSGTVSGPNGPGTNMQMPPFDSTMPGAEQNNSKVGGLDWKNRASSICEQVRLRGLDPQDFGCISKGSTMSPAYSWRGHTKMICGRLGTTMDPNLPVVSGCPPANWKGWALF